MAAWHVELQPATEQNLNARWSFGKPGERFRCGLCGYKFSLGDLWRGILIPANSPCRWGNFLICEDCHDEAKGQDSALLERREAMEKN